LHRLGLTTAVVTLVLCGTASAACPDLPTSRPFERWGDDSDYTTVPGGAFEGALGWDAVGAPTLVPEEDPFSLGGTGASSVHLSLGESITSPVLCLSRLHPHLRFVARAGGKSHLRLDVLWTDDKGKAKETSLEDHDSNRYRDWAPSRLVKLKKVLPKDLDTVRNVRLRFRQTDGDGGWLIDDVFVDPVKRG
jgi:hypothetical protein